MPNAWTLVTNEFVASHARKDCPACEGTGKLDLEKEKFTICACATQEFRSKFPPGSPRIKVSTQRIGNKDVKRIYYRNLAPLPTPGKTCIHDGCNKPVVDDGLYGDDWCDACLTSVSTGTGSCGHNY